MADAPFAQVALSYHNPAGLYTVYPDEKGKMKPVPECHRNRFSAKEIL